MAVATVTQMPRSTSITADQVRSELEISLGVPIVTLILLVARMQHQHVDAGGCGGS
jgi:hypothetical protein